MKTKNRLILTVPLICAMLLAASCAQKNPGGPSSSETTPAPASEITTTAAAETTASGTAAEQTSETATEQTSETAVSETETEASQPETEPEPETQETDTGSEPAESGSDPFKKGVWWATSDNEGCDDCYYYFYEDRDSGGTVLMQDYGIGVGFGYEIDGNKAVFHKGAADMNDNVTVTVTGEDTLLLEWDNGITETLKYMGSSDTFKFYSSRELCEMAKYYYAGNNNGYIPSEAAAVIQEDGLIAIQLYDLVSDHTSTSAWYTVDRFTGKGTDLNGGEVDLTEAPGFSGDTDVPFAKQRALMDTVGSDLGVCYLGYIDPGASDPDVYADYIYMILNYTGATMKFGTTFDRFADRFVSTVSGMELYIVIPPENTGSVTVTGVVYDEEAGGLAEGDELFRCEGSDVLLLKCNVSEIIPDAKVILTYADGSTFEWIPAISGENGRVYTGYAEGTITDFTDYGSLATVDIAPVG